MSDSDKIANYFRNIFLCIPVQSAFTPSASVLTAASKARGVFQFIKRSFSSLEKEIFYTSIYWLVRLVGETIHRIGHPSELSIPQKRHTPPKKNPKGSNKVGGRS